MYMEEDLKVCRNFGDTCQRLQVNKFIALLVVYFAHLKMSSTQLL